MNLWGENSESPPDFRKLLFRTNLELRIFIFLELIEFWWRNAACNELACMLILDGLLGDIRFRELLLA